ncbi:MAG: hypothetical protein H0V14_07090, partial [Chitinophagaceae bacterium]|nr:hypothetical protein [Chitinophagaceae bacterium]
VNSLLEDSEGILWVGTSTGLYRSDPAMNSFSRFSDPGSDLARDLIITGVLEDNQKALWINTSLGILKLTRAQNEVVIYGENHGVNTPSFTNNPGYYKGKNGELFFGGGSGYNTFFPEQLTGNIRPPQIVISNFRLADQPVMPGKGSPLREPLAQAKEIRLKYNQKVFSFDFAGIHYSSPAENRHLFMLEKLDNTWRKGGEEKTAYYYNVPPGRYVFRVKAANNDGVWAEKSIAVIVAPPWWLTWWAYVLYGLLFIGAAYAIYRIQRRRLLAAEREKARQHELAQAKEIEKAYEELKTTQAQLIQREKMASLGELTAGIAHEIQNPLNFVHNFSEVNKELLAELKNELNSGHDGEAISIANNIGENEEKIIYHSNRADAIVKGMLQHSRISTGQKEPTDINALTDEYLRLSYHGLKSKDNSFNATMQTNYDEGIGKVNIVPPDMGRVLLNLFNNAFYSVTEKKKKQGEQYEPIVSVTTKKIGDKTEIRVKDNGIGISQKILDKIFQPFFTTKPTGQGTGLGLSLAYDIVTKEHYGQLKVETKEGEGAEFVIQLPAR